MRKQAEAKLNQQNRKPKANKYGNKPTESHRIKFDSKKEANRYNELIELQNLSQIEDLRLQVHFTLQEQFKTAEGETVRAVTYIADFTYYQDGEYIVEDVKSEATRMDKTYRLKKRLMAGKGYKIREV